MAMSFQATDALCLMVFCTLVHTAFASADDLDRCVQSANHKTRPSKEGDDFKKYYCSPWADLSCCRSKTAQSIGKDGGLSLYNMGWDHCERNLSTACRQWFLKDTCFYECSPNLGPWIVLDKRSKKTRRERVLNAPLCATDCDAWFEACKDDLTCSDNWIKNWKWTKQGNLCVKECKTFKAYFRDSRTFCKNIFDESFDYSNGIPGKDCFFLWPNSSKDGGNPNTEVARIAQAKVSNEEVKDPRIEQKLDKCIISKHHKKNPGPEGEDYRHECIPWRAHSCCTSNTTKAIKQDGALSLYGMKWDHCRKLSKACWEYFKKDTCFYECSPNLGPWIVEDRASKHTRKEQFLNVPLCASDCDGWFEACKDDYTCSDNWGATWKWRNGTNQCKLQCKRFKDYFKDSVTFCNKIFNYSFQYNHGEVGKDCMMLWPDKSVKDLNREVAYLAAKRLFSHGCKLNVHMLAPLITLSVILFAVYIF